MPKKYIQTFEVRKGTGPKTKFPHADAKAIDLLERMLRLNAKVGIRATDALWPSGTSCSILLLSATPPPWKRAHQIAANWEDVLDVLGKRAQGCLCQGL